MDGTYQLLYYRIKRYAKIEQNIYELVANFGAFEISIFSALKNKV